KNIEEINEIIIEKYKDFSKEIIVGKKLIVVGVQEGISNPKELMERFKKEEVPVYKASEMKADNTTKKDDGKEKTPIYRHLMNGVSYMIPFIVVGGLLIAISLTLG